MGNLLACKKVKVLVLLILLVASSLAVIVRADELYPGPSELSSHGLMIWAFRISHPSPLIVGTNVTVEFTLQNGGKSYVTFSDSGAFASVRDPDNILSSFGKAVSPQMVLAPGENVTFKGWKVLNKVGTWTIWPSYMVVVNGQKESGPSEWHALTVSVQKQSIPFPDLTVAEIKSSRENNTIGCTIKNVGEATVKAGHLTVLYVDSVKTCEQVVPVDLSAGEEYFFWFNYEWPKCHTINVTVFTDYTNLVKESNETNNSLSRIVVSYLVPLAINSGPTLSSVTENSIVVSWTTNDEGDSLVIYSYLKVKETIHELDLDKQHRIVIGNLNVGTTYSLIVESTDSCGNIARSRTLVFETLPPHDIEAPSVMLVLPARLARVVNVTATVSDNVGISRIVFYVNGIARLTDYDEPYVLELNTSLYQNGPCTFKAVAYDSSGNSAEATENGTVDNLLPDNSPPTVMIVYPSIGGTVSGTVRVEALITEAEGHIEQVKAFIDSVYVRGWTYFPFAFDPFTREISSSPPLKSMSFVFPWNTSDLEPGSEHTIRIEAWDDVGNHQATSITVNIIKFEVAGTSLTPLIVNLEVTRSVTRVDNYFEVTLLVRNTGTVAISGLEVVDSCPGFQGLPKELGDSVSYDTSLKGSTVTMKYSYHHGFLEPRETATLEYYVVPILFNDITKYEIGFGSPVVRFKVGDESVGRRFNLPFRPSAEDLSAAFRSADYLIVTRPQGLLDSNPGDVESVQFLLSRMAELAKLKLGVLGYLPDGCTNVLLKDLISPGGFWANKLSLAFADPERSNAYMLLVGEPDVVPSYDFSDAKLSDQYYADVAGNGRPDLIVGRIVGVCARNLTRPIEASISVFLGSGYDRELALVTSGYEKDPDSADPVYVPFVDLALEALRDIQGQGVPATVIHWSNFLERAWTVQFTNYDGFTLGDIDGDGVDEVIIVRDEEGRAYLYEPTDGSLIRSFPCRFTRYDGLASGDVDGDGVDEIITAVDDDGAEGMIYVYKPDGTLESSSAYRFNNWDALTIGDVSGDSVKEIITVSDDQDMLRAYNVDGHSLWLTTSWHLDFTPYDSLSCGNLIGWWAGIYWNKDEVVVAKDDDHNAYIYGADGTQIMVDSVGYTRYDASMVAELKGGWKILTLRDDDETIFTLNPGFSRHTVYSRFVSDWFRGVRYTGNTGSDRHDGVAVGILGPGEDPRLAVIRNNNGLSFFQVIIPERSEADNYASEQFQRQADDSSVIVLVGHGNSGGVTPIFYSTVMASNFREHAVVVAVSCLAGDYEGSYSGAHTFPRAILDRGAAVLIASTEESYSSVNEYTLRNFFERWNIGGQRAGDAFTLYERERYPSGGKWPLWVREYNFYGDPKFPS
jgi:hypothetical protein